MKLIAPLTLLAFTAGTGLFLASARPVAAPAVSAAPESLDIDPVHSTVLFKIKHMGVSYVFGRFDDVTGKIAFDAAKPEASSVEITIKTESIDTNAAKRDAHLKSDSFFNVKEFPTATFKSKSVAKGGDHGFKVTGDLMLHGVTKSVTVEVEQVGTSEDPKGGRKAGFYSELKLKRSDFGITYMPDGLGEDVTLMISVEAGASKSK
jgi:polyisoprenoid-binding protein YceI